MLEERIGELEGLLKQQSTKAGGPTESNAVTNSSIATLATLSPGPALPDNALQASPGSDAYEQANSSESPPNASYEQSVAPGTYSLGNTTTNFSQQLLRSDWPTRLPQPDLLYHLVDVFFNCYPHARYLLHRPSFMISLTLSPKSPKFPHVSLLHAICAYAGVFSYLLEPPPTPDLEKVDKDFIFGDRRQGEYTRRDESFAEQHARWSKETRDEATAMGFNLLECTQALVIITGFYQIQGRWVELWMAAGQFFRCAVPLGLNARMGYRGDGSRPAPGFMPEQDGVESLLPEAANPVEREERVNLLWIGYANERFLNAPSSWAFSIDDQDVHQVLPCDLTHFEAGYDVDHADSRESIESPDVLLRHSEISDGFSLYVKGAILVSKTKTFNLRVRHKYPNASDIRELPEFHQLEQQVNLFRKSFPQRYHAPIVQTSKGLDIHVYAAHLISHYAVLLLHEKHVNPYSPNCSSAQKATAAARAILDLVYAVCSTSYDITRLAPVCPHCWYRAASFLTALFKVELSRGRHEEALSIDLEIQAIRFAFAQMGTRIPVALRYSKALDFELQAQTSQMCHSISQQVVPSERDDDSHVSPSSPVSSKLPESSRSISQYSGSQEETPAFIGYP